MCYLSFFSAFSTFCRRRLPEAPNAPHIAKIHPDEEGSTDNVFVWYESPKAGVFAVVPIVPHHEIVPGRDPADHPAPAVLASPRVGVTRRLPTHAWLNQVIDDQSMRRVPQSLDELRVGAHPLGFVIRLDLLERHWLVVDRQLLVHVFDTVAGQTHNSLDVVL